MAFKAKNINPIDLKPQTAVGVSIPFNGPAVFNSTYTTQEQLKSNIINYFLTDPNERFFNPIGGNLRNLIFEQITNGTLDDIRNNIITAMSEIFPNVTVDNVEVMGKPDENSIFIFVKYSVPNLRINDEIQISFDN